MTLKLFKIIDEERIAEEMKGFIADEEIDEGDEESDDDGTKRKHESGDELDDQLSDEDFDLIEENLGIKVKRKVTINC